MKCSRFAGALVVGVVLIGTLSGCGLIAQQVTKSAVENATGVKVDQTGKTVTVTGTNGQQATISSAEGKLPDGLPSYVPSYNGTIKSSSQIATDKGTNYTFTIETSDAAASVLAWYKDHLKSNGWTATATFAAGADQAMVQAKKAPNDTIIVTITKNSDGKGEIATIVDIGK
jgi:hypothetical protein